MKQVAVNQKPFCLITCSHPEGSFAGIASALLVMLIVRISGMFLSAFSVLYFAEWANADRRGSAKDEDNEVLSLLKRKDSRVE